MKSRLYNLCWICYNNYATVRLAAFLLQKLNNTGIINYRPRINKAASTVASERNVERGRFILNAKTDTVSGWSPDGIGFAKGFSVKKTACSMIAALSVAVKSYPKFFPTIPNEESPGNTFPVASDSIFSLLVRRDELGLSALFPLLAASSVDLMLPGAASSGGGLCL